MTEWKMGGRVSGFTPRKRTEPIAFDPKSGSRAAIEAILAHEFVHHVQFHEGWFFATSVEGWDNNGPPIGTTERDLAYQALLEGSAVYVTDIYADEYVEDTNRERYNSDRRRDQYEQGPPGNTYVSASYVAGAAYIHGQVEDPSRLDDLYNEDPPTSTYEILFPSAETTVSHHEPELTVNISNTEWWAKHDDRMGVLFLYTLLSTTHPPAMAEDVVRSFRGDHLVELSGPADVRPLVWALTFENGTAVDQFVTIFREALDQRTDPYAKEFAVERLSNETVIVLAGNEQLRQTAEIGGTGAEITVTFSPMTGTTSVGISVRKPAN
jgi:hypothetical protein